MKYIKLFESFNRIGAFSHYEEHFKDFKIERGAFDEIQNFGDLVEGIFDTRGPWSWNREGRATSPHFALNMKVYVWPDAEEILKALPKAEGIIDDLDSEWADFLQDQAEMWMQDLIERYEWINKVNQGGRSGGWLLISPHAKPHNYTAIVESEIDQYLEEKSNLSEEELEQLKISLNHPDWERLKDLGLSGDEGDAAIIIQGLANIHNVITENTRELERIEADLREIQQEHKDFIKEAPKYFIEELREKYELFEKKKPKGAPDWHDSNAPDAKGKFKSLGIRALASWLIRTRGRNMQRINGSLNQQIVFNRNKNPSYAAKMKKVREEVKRQLGKNK